MSRRTAHGLFLIANVDGSRTTQQVGCRMRLGYNTNGFAHHDPLDAIDVLHDIGYASVALTVDHHLLSPRERGKAEQLHAIRARLDHYEMASVVESGARFVLDPFHKHQPTLVSFEDSDRQRRIEFLKYCIDLAADLQSDCMSLWSGTAQDDAADEVLLERLTQSLQPVLEHAAAREVVLAFEPEPGMFIDSMAAFERLLQWLDADHFKLTLDVGHLFCQGEVPMVGYIQRFAPYLVNVHIEDMCAGVHEHLMFGEGQIHFPPVLEAFAEIGYQGGVHVELSRHSHIAPEAARKAFEFLAPLLQQVTRNVY